MSLSFAARTSARISATTRPVLAGNLRAFQTLSAPKRTTDEYGENRRSVGVLRNMTSSTQTPSVYLSALASSNFLSSSSLQYAAKCMAQTRSMSGVPESQQFRDGKPTLEYARQMPKTFASMTNEQVLHFAELSAPIPEACRECIVRDVMVVDQVEYDEAMKTFEEIAKTNREGMTFAAFPSFSGFVVAGSAGFISIPFVFNRGLVEWFNEAFVTSEMPPEQDLETFLEVGAASWGWMEPVLGQLSFSLLCMQFARSQMQNLGFRPYNDFMKNRRARYLIAQYPKYDPEFLSNYSKCDKLIGPHKMAK